MSQSNLESNLLDQAKETILRIDRQGDGLSIEEAFVWIHKNWTDLCCRHGDKVIPVFMELLSKFCEIEQDDEVDELSIQSIIGNIVSDEEEDVKSDNFMMWAAGLYSWDKLTRSFLENKSSKLPTHHDVSHGGFKMIVKLLLAEINVSRRNLGLKRLWPHKTFGRNARWHAKYMSEKGDVFKTSNPDYLRGVIAEDVAISEFKPGQYRKIAKEIFNKIVQEENVANPKITGAGIGFCLSEKGDKVFTVIRYTDQCNPRKDTSWKLLQEAK